MLRFIIFKLPELLVQYSTGPPGTQASPLHLKKIELNGEHKFKLVELKNKMPRVLPKIRFYYTEKFILGGILL